MKGVLMQRCLWVVVVLFLSVVPGIGVQASERDAAALIEDFFAALKAGNTGAILELCTDPILTQKRDLLENNRTYSKFLRDTYEKASMAINQVRWLSESEYAVDAVFTFPDGEPPLLVRFFVKNQAGVWKITSEEMLERPGD